MMSECGGAVAEQFHNFERHGLGHFAIFWLILSLIVFAWSRNIFVDDESRDPNPILGLILLDAYTEYVDDIFVINTST